MGIFVNNVDELMNFVEQTIKSDPKEMPDTLSDERSQYKAFLKLPVCEEYEYDHYSFVVYITYMTIFKIPKLKPLFRSVKHRRFLAHLIYQHAAITENNTIRTRFTSEGSLANPEADDYVSGSIALMVNYFKQSCAPNVIAIDYFDNTVYITLRPIKKGELVLQSLFAMFLLEPDESRKKIMLEHRKLNCKCSRCEGVTASREQRQQLASDPDYRYIATKNLALKMNDGDSVQAMVEKCHAFLKRYNDVDWCDEIAIVVDAYVHILCKQFHYPSNENFVRSQLKN